MVQIKMILTVAVALVLAGVAGGAMANPDHVNVTRATLDNGLRVVIVRDTLAPVATMEMNYLVGSNESPKGFPGTAHAVAHMMFRGSPGLSRVQLLTIASDLGGSFNASTSPGTTQYYFTVPSQDLSVALHIAAVRMHGVDMTEAGWKAERGAIDQEVSGDHSNPNFKLHKQLYKHLFDGTPYARPGLGTRATFDKTTAAALKKFHDTWYVPNNAILVVAGDVDPTATLAKVKSLFGDIPRKKLSERPAFDLHPVQTDVLKVSTDSPFGVVALSWRWPSLHSKDAPAALVLADALASTPGELADLAFTGKALFASFSGMLMPHAGVGSALAAFPRGGDAQGVIKNLQSVMADMVANGLPVGLIKAAKRKRIASLDYTKNSIPGLANAWSGVLVLGRWSSPDAMRADVAAVTPAQVNALAKKLFDPAQAVTAIMTPESSGKPVSHAKFGGTEKFDSKPSQKVTLPDWARASFAKLTLPKSSIHPTSFKLTNGLRVMVQPEHVSKTVEVFGRVGNNADMQEPKGKKGVQGLTGSLFRFGTTTLKRKQFQAALDAIAARASAGYGFSLAVPSKYFAQGMQLLADNELHPAMPERAFRIVQNQSASAITGYNQSPGFLDLIHLDRALYPADFPGLRYSTSKSISRLTLADAKDYYTKTVRSDLAAIVIIGDVTPEQVRKVVEATFGDWKAGGPKPDIHYPAVPPNKPSQFNTPDSSAVQDSVTLAQTMPLTTGNADIYAMNMGVEVLGTGGFHTRLMRDLRVKHGLVYGVGSSMNVEKHGSEFFVNYGCDPDKMAKARAMIIRDIRQMQKTPVTTEELHATKSRVLRQYQLGESSFGAIAGKMLDLALGNKPLDSYAVSARKYSKVTADQIQAAFKKYLRPDAFVTAVQGPAPQG